MNKKNTLSREIARVCTKVSGLTLTFTFVVFILVYLGTVNLGYALLGALSVGILSVIILSLTLPVKTGESISKKLNSLDIENPYNNELYSELTPLRHKIINNKKKTDEGLEAMNEVHLEQDKMRRDFTANVSHELKTPLTSIKGYSELLRDGMVKEEDVSRFAGKIYDESHRLITLVGDIIKLSQLDGNDVEVKMEEIDLFELTSAVISHLEMAAKEKDVTVTLTGDKPVIRGGEQIVEEMIFNVIDNAIKYNKVKGSVDVAIRQRIDGVELKVADTGIGIAEKDIPHIFERFWRADKSHSKDVGGTGLGLSIVKHGAMFMDASVLVESELEKGTTIRILF